ncbi:YhgE/Pip family protein [Staphylococcus gallinarum]|uniref:ABC-2 type transporter transmembrane domain-containing protein n=1 Tax=Staphylococcus gallinarum TaxID=1293 RepID=A0ABQ0Y5V5_STAGA|nr:YhgE/Pip family protein [Staphylococcus gallinarum]KIR10927.1 YhgE/Pip domain-containing protein [Staphylococcus gallinarum]MCD8785474.1 YhgE/Pip family protein [Staphylococcus gallinarum]MCD8794271.1 YhgE/Pip family protein [Staphylococcus gallinarum]MCD8828816.1 YhgE/Pip family protein [Staphylococcus gallinarum]MCD8858178.1 YhgE/Pip family protein [Staphylococcus gallinarum]
MFNEFKFIFRNKMLIVSLVSIALVSLLYVAFFVGSIWDPYDKTDQLKISVVNHDESAKMNGKKITVGDDLVDKLKDNDKFKFQEVSEEKAQNELNKGKSAGTIIIPKNASHNTTTLLDKHPKKIKLETQVNPGSSYTESQTAQKALDKVTTTLKDDIRSKYLNQLFAGTKKSQSGYQDTSDALGKMSNAESQLISGNQQVTDGLKQLEPAVGQPAQQLESGNQQVTDGLNQLKSNNDQLKQQIDNSISQQEDKSFESKNEKALNKVTKIDENNPTEADKYGETIVPYMASVSLFVVAVSFSAIYPLRKTLSRDISSFKQAIGKLLLYIVQGSLAALFMSCWVIFVFDMSIDNIGQFLITGILWAIAAITITTFLGLFLDRIGLFLSMILLILQLSASEGMFPIEMSAKFFRWIHPFSPMTYAIQGYREAIFTNAGHFNFSFVIGVLVGIIVVMMILQYLILLWFNKRDRLPFSMQFK